MPQELSPYSQKWIRENVQLLNDISSIFKLIHPQVKLSMINFGFQQTCFRVNVLQHTLIFRNLKYPSTSILSLKL